MKDLLNIRVDKEAAECAGLCDGDDVCIFQVEKITSMIGDLQEGDIFTTRSGEVNDVYVVLYSNVYCKKVEAIQIVGYFKGTRITFKGDEYVRRLY